MTILDQLADYARERVARDREKISFEEARLLAKKSGKAKDLSAFFVRARIIP